MKALRKSVFLFVLMGQLLWPFQSNAFFFLPFLAGAGGSAALADLGIGAAVTGLVVAGFIGAGGSDTSPSAQGQIAITPNGQALPSGWSRSSDGTPTPPSSTSPVLQPSDSIAASIGQQTCTSIGMTYNHVVFVSGNTWRVYCDLNASHLNYYNTQFDVSPNYVCPSGYTGTTSCVLADASSVKKPAGMPCQIIRVGNSFSADPRNPTCPAGGGDVSITDPNGNVLQVVNGQINVLPSTVVAGGSGAATEDKPNVSIIGDATGKTGVKQWYPTQMSTVTGAVPATVTKTTDIDSSGKVIGQGNVVTPGTGTQNNPAVAIPQTPSITCANIGTCDVATDTTQKAVKAATEEIRDRIKASSDTFAPPTAADYNPAIQVLNNLKPSPNQFTGPVTDMLRSLGVPSAGTQCELKRTLTLMGREFQINMAPDGICGPYQEIANWMTWMLVILYGWGKVRGMTSNSLEG